ncbi:DUF262 domain-containing protein [Jeotgalicoccus coquinae]|uniref:Uncharacterized protein with ParB-like and HNH nuclease domain n=1 Tax=Jeotgalicoccus coquinae TaxID=709509 RepID=A0ABR6QN65_9STAP|nr:DUF262 domain-containing protein [Jeotgalicoccus coquinae]MBB6423055.1 uncharacterized protein with ParB-like and HNH nuclease domain [Jeotgalicoccus coquinae]
MNDKVFLELEDLASDDNKNVLNPIKNEFREPEQIYPEANIKVERHQYPIFQLLRKYERNQIILDPDFQREMVWNNKQKSELIESVLMGIPLPIFYLNETKDGQLVVVDGRQRLTTFFSFLNNEFKLSELRILPNLSNCYFKDLDEKLQANLEDFQLIAQVIKPPTPDRIKFDIFDRVNRGGTPLNNQEMRNALYQGQSTELLDRISKSNNFIKATCNSVNSTRMKDKYLILRALAFYLWRKDLLNDANGEKIEYRNDIDEFLGLTMEYLNSICDEKILEIENTFYKSMNNNFIIFEKDSFRRFSEEERRKPINMILFESFSYLFTHFENEYCRSNSKEIRDLCNNLLQTEELTRLLTEDRGRGIVIPQIFNMMDLLKEELKNVN